jgi:hypothetical protein
MRERKKYNNLPINLKFPDGRCLDHIAKFKNTSFKLYFNAQHLLFQLNPLERSFYEYIIEHSDAKSRIFIVKDFKLEYIQFIVSVIGNSVKNITEAKVDQIVPKLKQLGLIISCNTRGLYYLNPKYAHKGSEKTRMQNVKNILEEMLLNNLPINMLVDVSEEQLYI